MSIHVNLTPESLLAILTIIGLCFGFAWRLFVAVKRVLDTVELVHKEFKPNGGSSLRDVVNRLEKQHVVLSAKVDNIIKGHLNDPSTDDPG